MRELITLVESTVNEVELIKPLKAAQHNFWDSRFAKHYDRDAHHLQMVTKIGDIEVLTMHWPLKESSSTFYFQAEFAGNIVGYASMLRRFNARPDLQSIGVIFMDSKFRKKGFGFAFYGFLIDAGYTMLADAEHTPASRNLWNKLCGAYDVRLADENGQPHGERLTSTEVAYDDPDGMTYLVASKL